MAISLAVAAVTIVGTHFASAGQPDARPLDWLAWALVLVGPVALLLHRRWPLMVYGLSTAVVLGYWAAGYPFGPVFLAALVMARP